MKKVSLYCLVTLIIVNSFLLSGCWNYREIDDLGVVAGVAIDKGKEKKFEITVEVVKVTGGRESKTEPLLQSTEGDTMFEAARNQISKYGKKLYWPHAKVIIVSSDLAREGLISVLDWYNRDSETRGDVDILISREKTAKEILESDGTAEDIISFTIEETIKNQKSLSKAPQTQLWEVLSDITSEGISATAATIGVEKVGEKKVLVVRGTSVFKQDKLIGFLDEESTVALQFIKDEIKGGVIPFEEEGEQGKVTISLEIFKNKTKVKPIISGKKAEIMLEIHLELAVDEIEGSEDVLSEKKKIKLEDDTAKELKEKIEDVIKQVQSEFSSDIFGFGSAIHGDKPKEWEALKKDWEKIFKEVKVTVEPHVHIRHSAMMAKSIKIGD